MRQTHTATGRASLGKIQVVLGSLVPPWLLEEKRSNVLQHLEHFSYVLQTLLDVFVIQLFAVLLNYAED